MKKAGHLAPAGAQGWRTSTISFVPGRAVLQLPNDIKEERHREGEKVIGEGKGEQFLDLTEEKGERERWLVSRKVSDFREKLSDFPIFHFHELSSMQYFNFLDPFWPKILKNTLVFLEFFISKFLKFFKNSNLIDQFLMNQQNHRFYWSSQKPLHFR
jgi:hypothetical protein